MSTPPGPNPATGPATRRTVWPRVLFALYALVLVTATHWPGLTIEAPSFTRLDLAVHAGAFGCWMLLFAASGFFGPFLSRRNLGRSLTVAAAYAAVDELSQGIPAVNRSVDATDLAANWGGIVLVGVVLLVWIRMRAGRQEAR